MDAFPLTAQHRRRNYAGSIFLHFGGQLFHPAIVLFHVLLGPLTSLPSGDAYAGSLPSQSTGPIRIEGRVADAITGETLPMATIQVEGTFSGTVANADGAFDLTIDTLPVTLLVRYLGYRSARVPILESPSEPIDVLLEPSSLDLPEVVVTGEDPAISIMERVIARKQLWRPGLFTYRANAYSRLRLGRGEEIVMIAESVNEVYWDREGGTKETLKRYENTSNIDDGIIPLGVGTLPNFYDDDIEILNYDVVGVTHPDALDYYSFKLIEYNQLDDQLIYRIAVTPKRKLQPTFEGEVFVLDGEFALVEVRLRPGESIFFPPPAQEVSFTYTQRFSNYGGEFWLPVDSRVEGTIRIGLPGLQFPEIRVSQIARVSDFDVNATIPRDILERERSVTVDSVSVMRGRFVGMESDRVPLTEQEQDAYGRIDSTMTIEKAFSPRGILAKAFSLEVGEEEGERDGGAIDTTRSAFDRLAEWIPGSFVPVVGVDRVNGVSAGLAYEVNPFASFALGARAAHATHTGDWSLRARVLYRPWLAENRANEAGGDGGEAEPLRQQFTAAWYDEWTGRHAITHFPEWAPSLTYLLGGEDVQDHYRRAGWTIGTQVQQRGWAAGLDLAGEENTSLSPSSLFTYSLTGHRSVAPRVNPLIDEGRHTRLNATLGYAPSASNPLDEGPLLPGFQGANRIRLTGEWGLEALGGDYVYRRMGIDAQLSVKTFYRRRFFPNTLNIEAAAGMAHGDLPSQRLFAVESALLSVAPFGVLKTLSGPPYEGNRFWRIHAEHDFKSIPFEMVGWMWPSRKGIGVVAFVNAANAWFAGAGAPIAPSTPLQPVGATSPQATLFRTSNGVHAEAGVSLNGLFSILRLDAAWRLDSPGVSFTAGVARWF